MDDTVWICRAEGTLADGRKGKLDLALGAFSMEMARADAGAMRKSAERQVLLSYFHHYDQVPYRISWWRDGREWLEPVTRECCWRDDSQAAELELAFRDTRDHTHTATRESQ